MLQSVVTTQAVAAVCDRRFSGAHRAPLQAWAVAAFRSPQQMPTTQWTNLPATLRDYLFERLRERKIRIEDLYALKLWRESEPEAPEGEWYKDFGSFKICGEGRFPKTFLLAGQSARGKRL